MNSAQFSPKNFRKPIKNSINTFGAINKLIFWGGSPSAQAVAAEMVPQHAARVLCLVELCDVAGAEFPGGRDREWEGEGDWDGGFVDELEADYILV